MRCTAERWANLLGYDGTPVVARTGRRYEVSSLGRVRSISRFGVTRELKQSTNIRGHRVVHISDKFGSYTVGVHTAMLGAFVGPRPDGFTSDWINGDRSDNRLENLRYAPATEVYPNRHETKRLILVGTPYGPAHRLFTSMASAAGALGCSPQALWEGVTKGRSVKGHVFRVASRR